MKPPIFVPILPPSNQNDSQSGAPKESWFRNSRFGLLSLATFIILLILLCDWTSSGYTGDFLGPIFGYPSGIYIPVAISLIAIIFAVIGLFADKEKRIAIAVLIISFVLPVGCFALLLVAISSGQPLP